MEEIWKDIKGFEGIYQVSNIGRVKNLERKVKCKNNSYRVIKEKILKPNKSKHTGYYMVTLSKNGKQNTYSVHRLVATAFLDNPENKPCVDHINTIRTDNRIENLRWVSYEENYYNPITLERHKLNCFTPMKNMYGAKHNRSKAILQYSIDGEFIREYGSIIEAGKYLNIRPSCISMCCRGYCKKSGGYIWKYKEVA